MRELAQQLKEKYPRIDVLANNAGGIMGAAPAHRGRPREDLPDQPPRPVPAHHRADGRAHRQQGHRHQHLQRGQRLRQAGPGRPGLRAELLHQPRLRHRQARQHPLHHRAAPPLRRRGNHHGGLPPGRGGHQLRGRVHQPDAARVQDLPQPLPAEPGAGRGHAGVARHRHARAGLGLRRRTTPSGRWRRPTSRPTTRSWPGSCGTAARQWWRRISTSSTTTRSHPRRAGRT